MVNGNGGVLTPAKTIGICISITLAVNGVALTWVQDVNREMDEMRHDLERRTDQRYRASDAARDFRVVDERFNNVVFRFQRNEENIRQCLEHIKRNGGAHSK
jgi:hypothetical protein